MSFPLFPIKQNKQERSQHNILDLLLNLKICSLLFKKIINGDLISPHDNGSFIKFLKNNISFLYITKLSMVVLKHRKSEVKRTRNDISNSQKKHFLEPEPDPTRKKDTEYENN